MALPLTRSIPNQPPDINLSPGPRGMVPPLQKALPLPGLRTLALLRAHPSWLTPRKAAGAGPVLGLPDPYLGRVGQDLLHVLSHSDGASCFDFVYKMPQHWCHLVFCRLSPGAEVFPSPKTGNDYEKQLNGTMKTS